MKNRIAFLFLLFCSTGYGQISDIKQPVLVPSSPEIASLAKNEELNVGLQSGAANFSLPIFSIDIKGVSVPISIAYSSNGLKVDQVSSRVGHDWSLNAGGYIQRIVQGKPDDQATRSAPPQAINNFNQTMVNYLNNLTLQNSSGYDSEADLYSYNFLGYSGKFYVRDNGTVVQLPHTNLKIEIIGSLSQIVITNTEGVKFRFGDVNTEVLLSKDLDGSSYVPSNTISTLFLYRVEALNGQYINLEYQSLNNTTKTGLSYSVSGEMNVESMCPGEPGNEINYTYLFKGDYSGEKVNSVTYATKYIKSIYSSKGQRVNFTYENRSDNSGDVRLRTITIPYSGYNRVFELSYFTPSCIGQAHAFSNYNVRFFLEYLDQYTTLNTSKKIRHTFQYYDLSEMPYRLSNSQDHWGFYNGALNQNLIPYNNATWATSYANADRSANALFAVKGMLKEVKYPTGGSSYFEYEGNDNGYGGVRVKSISTKESISSLPIYRYFFYSSIVSEQAPDYYTVVNYKKPCPLIGSNPPTYTLVSKATISSNSLSNVNLYNGYHLGYEHVIESNSPTFVNGKIEHNFLIYNVYSASNVRGEEMKDVPQGIVTDLSSFEYSTKYFDANGNVIKSMEKGYSLDTTGLPSYINYKVRRKYEGTFVFVGNNLWQEDYDRFDIASYQYVPAWIKVLWEEERNYNPDNLGAPPNVRRVDYSYGGKNNVLPNSVSKYDSHGQLFITQMKYPLDFAGTAVYNLMGQLNFISPVIESKMYKGSISQSNLLMTSKSDYKNWSGNIFAEEIVTVLKGAETTGQKLVYYAYDAEGNILSVGKEGDKPVNYLWGYSGLYPVAKVVGKTKAEVDGAGVNASLINSLNVSDVTLASELSKLRTLGNALVSTYSYVPFVGMSSETDPTGRSTKYIYDDFNRLQSIRDHEGKILKFFCYNYAGLQEDCSVSTASNWIASGVLRCAQSNGANNGSQEAEEVDQNPNSTTYQQARWVLAGTNTTACPLPAPPCTLTFKSGYNNISSGITNNGSTATIYMVLTANVQLTVGSSYYVADISGTCKPSSTRTINIGSGGRTWIMTIYSGGQVYLKLQSGSNLPAYTTLGISNQTYSL